MVGLRRKPGRRRRESSLALKLGQMSDSAMPIMATITAITPMIDSGDMTDWMDLGRILDFLDIGAASHV